MKETTNGTLVPDSDVVNWLTYADVDISLTTFVGSPYVVTNAFSYRQLGDQSTPVWEMEEWCVGSILVPADRLDEAQKVLSFDDLKIEPHWVDRQRFDFGAMTEVRGIPAKLWCYMREHPTDKRHMVEIQRDFLIYHALDQRGNGEQYELIHPLDNLEAVRVRIERHAPYNPSLRLEVHRDYLRDYLAASGLGLVVAAVADRFRNAPTSEHMTPALSGTPCDVELAIHEMEERTEKFWHARSIIRRTTTVKPYTNPKPERSPWYCYDVSGEASSKIEFIADAEGTKSTLKASPPYLYFKPGVLRKYLDNPNDSVFFHMRTWGAAQPAGATESIDVGINSAGLVNAFAWDLEKQSQAVQQYWSSFSCLPSGEICEELFQTRMQQNPPPPSGTIELVQAAIKVLNSVYASQFSEQLHAAEDPNRKTLARLSVGPLEENGEEVAELAKDLYAWVIEGFGITTLRKALGPSYDNNWKQIKLIEGLASVKLGLTESDAKAIGGPLKDLNTLRVKHAHSLDEIKLNHLSLTGLRVRKAWFVVVDGVLGSLRKLADHLKT